MRVSMGDDDLAEQVREADPANGAWSPDQMLLATAIDELRTLQYLFVASKVKKGQAGRPPEPLPRPGVSKKTARRRSRLGDEQRRALEAFGGGLRVVRDGETGT